MNLKSVRHRVAQGCGVCLPLLLIVGLTIPGCAGKRSDMLSSLIKPKQAETGAGESPAETPGDDASALIADADEQQKSARLSAFTAEEIIEGRPRFGRRVRSLFSRNDEAATAGDPFLDDERADPSDKGTDSAEDRKAIAGSENARVEELLASFETAQREPITEVKPWWESSSSDQSQAPSTSEQADVAAADARPKADPKTTFSRQFDSRLERLRAELELDDESIADTRNSTETPPAAHQPQQPDVDVKPTIEPRAKVAAKDAPQQDRPVATAVDHSQDLPIVIGNARTGGEATYPSLMTQPRHPLNASQATAEKTTDTTVAEPGATADARQRVLALMDDARQDWQAWKLHRAYQTVVAAHKLATREKVRFLAGEEQPRDLARKIVVDLKQDAALVKADKAPRALATNPFKETDELGIRSAAATFGFDDLERLASPWTAKSPTKLKSARQNEPTLAKSEGDSQNSGVSLLPPDDDFPSDATERDWANADPRDIRLATHNSTDFARSADQQVREKMNGLSATDNQALLQNVADQKSRVLKSNSTKWPQLPAGHQPALRADRSDGPIRVAEAPRFSLEDDVAIAAVPTRDGAANTDASGGSLLGQFWRSQPIWFIGGLVLLVIALRLWPSSKQEEI